MLLRTRARRGCHRLAAAWCAFLCLAAVAGGGCRRGSASAPDSAPAPPPLLIGAYYWPGSYWVDIANDRGWFREAGVDVRVVDTNADFFASLRDLAAGRLDICHPTLYDLILLHARGVDLLGVAVSDQSAGADGIVSIPSIGSIAGLRGHRIGVPKGTYSEYLLSVVLRSEGVSTDEVSLVDILAEAAAEALAAGRVDAVVTWEPELETARARVHGVRLWDSSITPGISPSIISTRRTVLRERRDDLQKVLAVWRRASALLDRHPDEAYALVARANHKTIDEVRSLALTDRRVGLRDNLAAFSFASGFESLHGSARVMTDFQFTRGLIAYRPDTADLLDPALLRTLR